MSSSILHLWCRSIMQISSGQWCEMKIVRDKLELEVVVKRVGVGVMRCRISITSLIIEAHSLLEQ